MLASLLCPFSIVVLSRIGAAAVIAQPEPHEVTPAFRLRVILERGAAVAERAVVDDLDLPGFEIEIGSKPIVVEDVEHRRQGRSTFLIDRLSGHRIAATDLVRAEPRP